MSTWYCIIFLYRAPEQQAVEESELNAKEDEHKTGKAVQHTADHDYEMLESYNQNLMYDEVRCADIQSSGNYKLTQCPAYVPVATSQLEMVEECNS